MVQTVCLDLNSSLWMEKEVQDPEDESKQKDDCGRTLKTHNGIFRLFANSLKAVCQTSLGKKKKVLSLRFYPAMQGYVLVCHLFMDADREYKTPGSEAITCNPQW